jgi:hypothetical protein
MNKNKLPIYQAKVSLTDDTGIFAISFVDYPANESNFLALKKATEVKLNLNRSKQILTGAVLIPDQLIYRNDVTRGEYYIKFSAQDIEQIAQKMMKTGVALNNTTHQHETGLKGNYLIELWIVQDPKRDKSVALGLGEYPKGTLMASYKVADANYWKKEVLSGNVKGFSLEGYFNFNNINMNKNKKPAGAANPATKKGNPMAALLRSMAVMLEGDSTEAAEGIVDEAKKDETDSGEPVMIFDLADGGQIWVDETGFCTIDGEQAPAGDHALADGNVIVIDDSGNLVVTQEEGEATDPETPPVDAATLAAAKAMGNAYLAKLGKAAGKAPVKGTNAAQIAKLQAEIDKLKKTPSAKTAKAKVEAGAQDKPETFTGGVAKVLAAKLARKKGE